MIFPRILCLAAAAAVLWSGRADAADRLTVTVSGHGPEVILVPGLASSRGVWDVTAAQLSPTHRVHVVQVAGFAGTPAGGNASGPVVAPVVEQLHAYIVAEHLKSPALIGHSLGGVVGIKLALEHPGDLGRLMIVDALPFFSVIVAGPQATVASVTPIAAGLRDKVVAMSQKDFAASEPQQMAGLVKSKGPEAQAAIAAAAASDHDVVARAMYDVMTTDLRPRVAELKLPVTMLYPWDAAMGAPQAVFDGLYTSAYAALPMGTVKRIDGSFHFIQVDQPAAFADAVAAFLK